MSIEPIPADSDAAADIGQPAQIGVEKPIFLDAVYPAELDPADPNGQLHLAKEAPPFALPPGADAFTLSCDRMQFQNDPALIVKCRAYISFDGGQSRRLLCSFTTTGGAVPTADGLGVSAVSAVTVYPIAEANNPNRLIYTQLIPLKTLRTSVSALCRKA